MEAGVEGPNEDENPEKDDEVEETGFPLEEPDEWGINLPNVTPCMEDVEEDPARRKSGVIEGGWGGAAEEDDEEEFREGETRIWPTVSPIPTTASNSCENPTDCVRLGAMASETAEAGGVSEKLSSAPGGKPKTTTPESTSS